MELTQLTLSNGYAQIFRDADGQISEIKVLAFPTDNIAEWINAPQLEASDNIDWQAEGF